MKVYAVVLNWNKYIDTSECIESLLKSSSPVKVILVDNGSEEGIIELLQRDYAQNDNVHIIRNNANWGFARGINIGIRHALEKGADFIFLLNNDAVIDSNCITLLLKAMDISSDIGLAGPRIFYHKHPQRIWSGGGYFSRLKAGVITPEKNKLVNNCNESVKYVTFLTGCALMIRQEVFKRIGLLDECFFFYGEDLDFCLRAIRAGFKLLYVPEAKVWHKIEDIAKDRTSSFVLYHLARSNILVLSKNFNTAYFLYGLLIHLIGFTPYRIAQIIMGSRSLSAFLAWWRGTWAGLMNK